MPFRQEDATVLRAAPPVGGHSLTGQSIVEHHGCAYGNPENDHEHHGAGRVPGDDQKDRCNHRSEKDALAGSHFCHSQTNQRHDKAEQSADGECVTDNAGVPPLYTG